MSDLEDLGYISVICLGIIAIFQLKGVAYSTTTGRAAAARNILLAIVLGIYLYKHAIAVLGLAFVALGYLAIATESNSQASEAKVRKTPSKAVTRKTTIKKSPLRKVSVRRTPVRRNASGSFQPATRFSVPSTIFDAPPRREPVFDQKARENFEAFKRELEEQYGPLIEKPRSDSE